jgi:hypothetical protein
MEKTPEGTSVGVEDPYEHVGVCDHLTGDGTCRFAFDRFEADPSFARDRRADDYACPIVDADAEIDLEGDIDTDTDTDADEIWTDWRDCPHFRSTATDRECARCGLEEKRMAHDPDRPLLEEHHLSYADGSESSHELTVYLCRWCHAKVHNSWAKITDDASPDPEAIAALEERRGREQNELGFDTARERRADDRNDSEGEAGGDS